jgi:hypothetical protein
MVQEKNGGHLHLVDAGTGAVLHGMMRMLSEVLDGLDRRLETMESRLAELADRPEPAPLVLPEPPPPPDPPEPYDDTAVRQAIDAVIQRIDAVQHAVDERGSRVHALVEGLVPRLEQLEQLEPPPPPDPPEPYDDTAVRQAIDAVIQRIDAVQHAVDERGSRVHTLVEGLVPRLEQLEQLERLERLEELEPALTTALAGARTEADAAAARLAAQVEGSLDESREVVARSVEQGAASVLASVEERIGAVEGRLTEQLVAVAQRLADMERWAGERVDGVESRIIARVAEVEVAVEASGAAVAGRLGQGFDQRLDEVAGRLAERVGQAEQVAVGNAEEAERRIGAHVAAMAETATGVATSMAAGVATSMATGMENLTLRLAEIDATLAALRAESAALPANVGEQVQVLVGNALSGWRNRLRRGEGEEGSRKVLDQLALQLARVEETLGDGLNRMHDAVNRAQGESLEAAQTTSAEVRRLLDAAQAEAERSAGHVIESVVGEQRRLAGDVVDQLRRPASDHEEQLDAMAALAERLVAVQDELARRDAALAESIRAAATEAAGRLAATQEAVLAAIEASEDDSELRRMVGQELARLREAVLETHARAGSVASSVAKQVDEVVQHAATVLGERVARERAASEGVRRDVESVAVRIDELGKSVAATRRELPDVLRSVVAEADLGQAVEAVQAAVAGLAASEKERVEQGRAVLDAVTNANQEHHEVLHALHSSLAKRFDARTKSLAETLDGLVTSLEAARKLGPSLDKVSTRLDAQQPYLDQIRHQLVQLAASITAVPADVERRHAEATASLQQVTDSLAGLRQHAAALDRAVQAMRASQEGLAAAFIDLRDGNGVVPQRLDQIGAAVQAGRRQLVEVGDLTRGVAGAVEQQQAMGARLAELVSQVRAATRSDIERVESSIHLEVLKQHQQDQARLTQAVAGVSEVVEREAAVIHQRVSALAAEVDAMRLELAGGRPEN